MISFWNFIGLLIVILGGLLLLLFLARYRKKSPSPVRVIPALERFRQAVGLSVEDGRRLHVSLGSASIVQPNNASALVGLAALERLAGVSMLSDRPPGGYQRRRDPVRSQPGYAPCRLPRRKR